MWVLVVGWTPQTAHASEGETDTRALAVFPVQGKLGIHAHLAELVSERVLLDVRQRAAFGRIMSPAEIAQLMPCLLYTSPSPRDRTRSRMPSSA